MEVAVLRSGPLTTVQDRGRRGHRAAGVPLSGALDPFALRLANLLVGNPEGAAGLEFNLVGPELEFSTDALIALGGAECAGLPRWKPVAVVAGTRLAIGPCTSGARGYLCISGGITVPPVLGSRSTYLAGGFGGLGGRALRNGDVINVGDDGASVARLISEAKKGAGNWRVDPRILPGYSASPTIRVIRGAQADEFGADFFSTEFRISQRSDRMGFRLENAALVRKNSDNLLSVAVAPGTIQVPPDGAPVVLMADAQTLGGYPQIAHVIAVDLPIMAQLKPGDSVKFVEVNLHEAHRLASAREWGMAMLREGLAEKFRIGRRS